MTIKELETLDSLLITPAQAAAVLKMDANSLRYQARENPAALGFPVIVAKSRVKIPREPFLRFIKGE